MSRRSARLPEAWPRLMQAVVAAAYCGESSVESFRRSIPGIWPRPKVIAGKGERWLREDLDQAIDRLTQRRTADAADIL